MRRGVVVIDHVLDPEVESDREASREENLLSGST